LSGIAADLELIEAAEIRIQANKTKAIAAQRRKSLTEIDRENKNLLEEFLNVEFTD